MLMLKPTLAGLRNEIYTGSHLVEPDSIKSVPNSESDKRKSRSANSA